ncbi:MAG: glycosyltransferase [Oleiphilaceae bacterium]|nr:glycosyltransferase [Oleiphilaceae bacterium]
MTDFIDLSIVIPAYNEERFIKDTLSCLVSELEGLLGYEVIVVDHGSTDNTALIAEESGATVVNGSMRKTVGELRNLGVEQSKGRLLVFIDADICVQHGWGIQMKQLFKELSNSYSLVSGSFPILPDGAAAWLINWFEPKGLEKITRYIGSGHLVISRSLFDEIGGFDPGLETSEDVDLCRRAIDLGANLRPEKKLRVCHAGAPTGLVSFIRREAWHGRGDVTSVRSFFSSRAPLTALVFMTLHFAVLLFLFTESAYAQYPAYILFILILFSTVYKFHGSNILVFFFNFFTFYFYLFGRSIGLIRGLISRDKMKRSRA